LPNNSRDFTQDVINPNAYDDLLTSQSSIVSLGSGREQKTCYTDFLLRPWMAFLISEGDMPNIYIQNFIQLCNSITLKLLVLTLAILLV
jgi:hypothetical protein